MRLSIEVIMGNSPATPEDSQNLTVPGLFSPFPTSSGVREAEKTTYGDKSQASSGTHWDVPASRCVDGPIPDGKGTPRASQQVAREQQPTCPRVNRFEPLSNSSLLPERDHCRKPCDVGAHADPGR